MRLLGELVGEVLREQGGDDLFDAVEHVRQAAIRLRSTDGSDQALLSWAEHQSTLRLLHLVRAFSVYFHLINLAEQHHRVRTLRERQTLADGPAARIGRRRLCRADEPRASVRTSCGRRCGAWRCSRC